MSVSLPLHTRCFEYRTALAVGTPDPYSSKDQNDSVIIQNFDNTRGFTAFLIADDVPAGNASHNELDDLLQGEDRHGSLGI